MNWLLTILLATGACPSKLSDGAVILSNVKVEGDLVYIGVELHLEEEKTIFEWRGHVYPLLRKGLFVDVRTTASEEFSVESAIKHVPKIPQERHGVRAQSHSYREPLRLEIRGRDGRVPTGCVEITIRYDTTAMRVVGPLDRITLDPAVTEVCFSEQTDR